MYTVPNQNIITIHRQYPKSDFLQIKNENWQNMIKKTKDTYALSLYLYFASNADNYNLAISPAAIENTIGMARATYYKKFDLLKRYGYIIEHGKNHFDFYEVPQEQKEENCGLPCEQGNLPQKQQILPEKQGCFQHGQNSSPQNREINNIYTDKVDKINKDSQKQRKKEFIF